MTSKVGTLLIDLVANVARLQADMQKAGGIVASGVRDMQRSARSLQGAFQGVLVGTGVSLFTREVIQATRDAEQQQARLQAVLRATGFAAGFTREQLNGMAQELAAATQFDDESITRAQSELLKFGNIHGEVFTGALALSADLAAFMGTSVPEAAALLGKGLNSPTEGLTTMERQFGKLTEAQEAHIKKLVESGRAIEAQNAVLDLWRQKIAGAAAEMNTGITRSTSELSKAWNELLEAMGRSDAVGGTLKSVFGGASELLRDVQKEIEGTRTHLRGFFIEFSAERLSELPGALGLLGKFGMTMAARERGAVIAAGRAPGPATQLKDWMEPGPPPNVVLGGKTSPTSATKGKTAADILDDLAGVSKDFNDDLALLHAEYASGRLKLDEYRAAVEKLVEKQRFARDLAEEQKRNLRETVDWAKRRIEQEDAQSDAVSRATEELRKYTHEQQFELEIMGFSEIERQKLTEFRRIDLQVTEASTDKTIEQIEALRAWAEEAKKAYADVLEAKVRFADQDARIASSLEMQKRAQSEADRTRDILAQSITDGIMRGFERGEGFWENFRNSIRRSVLTVTIQPVVNGISQAIAAPLANLATAGTNALLGQLGLGGGGLGGLNSILFPGGGIGGGLGTGMVESMSGVNWGLSNIVEDASGNITFAPTQMGSAVGALGNVAPYLPAMYQLMQGNAGGAALAAGGALIGNMIMPGIGGVIGGMAGSLLGGDDEGDAMRTGNWVGGLGERSHSSSNRWFGYDMGGAMDAFSTGLATQEQNLIRNRGLDSSQVAAVNAALASVGSRQYRFGMEHTDVRASGAFEQIAAARMQAISEALGASIEDLAFVMSKSAEEFEEARDQVAANASRFLAQLPDVLGITGIENAQASLAIADFQAPVDRFAAARTQLQESYNRASAGDLQAVHEFPQILQQALAVGRDVYASGPQWAELFVEGNRMLQELKTRQEDLRGDLTKDIPSVILQAGDNTVQELRKQTAALVEQLKLVQLELRRIPSAA